jgi:hypothetical protein
VVAKIKMELTYNQVPLTLLCFWTDYTKGWKLDEAK